MSEAADNKGHDGDVSCLHVRRVVIEAVTPLSPASGESSVAQDNFLTRDMNDLPQLYGPALAGVLRHVYRDYHGERESDDLFGYIKHGEDEGNASRIELSFGFVHDGCNRPVEGLIAEDRLWDDDVLAFLRREAPVKRDRVKMDGRGVASDTGKFDRTSIPAGTRFTIEMVLEGGADNKADDARLIDNVVALFECPYLRVGGNSRQAGKVRILKDANGKPQIWGRCFERTQKEGWQACKQWRGTPLAAGAKTAGLSPVDAMPPLEESVRKPLEEVLTLTPEDFWRFGVGEALLSGDKPADQAPLHEAVIYYEQEKGQIYSFSDGGVIKAPFVASGLKGALAHRAEFHLNRLNGNFADEMDEKEFQERLTGEIRDMDALFGSLKGDSGGRAGCLFLDDVYIQIDQNKREQKIGLQAHNSLDRFAQGVRNRVLFSEEMLFGTGEVKVNLCLLTQIWKNDEFQPIEENVIRAFQMALDDLCAGRLAIGGGHHGYCTGHLSGELQDRFATQTQRKAA